MTVDYQQYDSQLRFQVANNHPVKSYCPHCHWGVTSRSHVFCSFGHGQLAPISEYFAELTEGI